jgi:two-component system chemotaxis response regulator CheB
MLAIGFSAGGIPLAQEILAALPPSYPLAVAVVAHIPAGENSVLPELLSRSAGLPATMACDKTPILPGHVHVAPPGYHLLVEDREHYALSVDAPVMSVRPSIDVLLESAAESFEQDLIALVLSGANSDGARGMARVHELGGMTIVLSPLKAEFRTLPEAVINAADVDYIASVEEIIALLRAVEDEC